MLIIDDPGAVVLSFFRAAPYDVKFATHFEASTIAGSWRPAIVLLDTAQIEHGPSFVRSLKLSPSVLVVAISAAAQVPELVGTVDISLVQPVNAEALHEMLSAWPARARTTRRIRKSTQA